MSWNALTLTFVREANLFLYLFLKSSTICLCLASIDFSLCDETSVNNRKLVREDKHSDVINIVM
jgi:hypothetical protein